MNMNVHLHMLQNTNIDLLARDALRCLTCCRYDTHSRCHIISCRSHGRYSLRPDGTFANTTTGTAAAVSHCVSQPCDRITQRAYIFCALRLLTLPLAGINRILGNAVTYAAPPAAAALSALPVYVREFSGRHSDTLVQGAWPYTLPRNSRPRYADPHG